VLEALARAGLVAKGISYGIVGVLALKLAFGEGGKATSRTGALKTLAQNGFGKALIIALALGFAAYAAWRIAQAVFVRDEDDMKVWAKRAGYGGRAGIYGLLTYEALKVVFGDQGESQNQKAHKATAHVLSWPAGTWIVGLAGVVIAGVGLFNGYRAVTQSFEQKWDKRKMNDFLERWGAAIGTVGLLSRLVVFGAIGFFAVKAAVQYDPKEAVGFDGALQRLANESYGPWLLGVTAVGLIAYALFCFVEARYREV
jgi:hypothetical protein